MTPAASPSAYQVYQPTELIDAKRAGKPCSPGVRRCHLLVTPFSSKGVVTAHVSSLIVSSPCTASGCSRFVAQATKLLRSAHATYSWLTIPKHVMPEHTLQEQCPKGRLAAKRFPELMPRIEASQINVAVRCSLGHLGITEPADVRRP